MTRHQIRCKSCRRLVLANPRLKEQEYCGQKQCQQARKNEWRRQQRKKDPLYRRDERDSRQKWIENNPEYERLGSGEKSVNKKPINTKNPIHSGETGGETGGQKRDALTSFLDDNTKDYVISRVNTETGKRDALKVRIAAISTS